MYACNVQHKDYLNISRLCPIYAANDYSAPLELELIDKINAVMPSNMETSIRLLRLHGVAAL
jgi:hypothetical protein